MVEPMTMMCIPFSLNILFNQYHNLGSKVLRYMRLILFGLSTTKKMILNQVFCCLSLKRTS